MIVHLFQVREGFRSWDRRRFWLLATEWPHEDRPGVRSGILRGRFGETKRELLRRWRHRYGAVSEIVRYPDVATLPAAAKLIGHSINPRRRTELVGA